MNSFSSAAFKRLAAWLLTGIASALISTVATGAYVPAPTGAGPFNFSEEVRTRQLLTQVALGREKADLIIRGANVLDVRTLTWMPDQDIVVKAKRIAWVGPRGQWPGEATAVHDATGLYAVPGFGESHKHIESSLVSPEWEAKMVLPLGNTWTIEATHEFSNVDGAHNVEFWFEPRKQGVPLKIFPSLGSATPPTAYETGGGFYGYQEIREQIQRDPWVVGIDEVMDWAAVSNPSNPGHQRIWENIQAAIDARGVVEGHGAGLLEISAINAFAAAGLASDHETRFPDEAWKKLQRGVFLQLKKANIAPAISYFMEQGIKDWSNISLVTDDLDAGQTLELGTLDKDVRNAIKAGAPVEAAYAMVSYYPARHHRVSEYVGSITPGRYADVVLISDVNAVKIERVIADGIVVSKGREYLLQTPKIAWPDWATKTINVGRKLVAKDFEIAAPAGKTTEAIAAIQRASYTDREQKTAVLPIVNGVVERDLANQIVKAATVDRYSGQGKIGKVFWTGLGPLDPDCAVASSQSHDLHNIAVVGSSDEAMAVAVNKVAELQGGIVLVRGNQVAAYVQMEIGGLMADRPPEVVAKELEAMYAVADQMKWSGAPGFPHRIRYCMITCSPYTWRLVIPYAGNPGGLVNLVDGATFPIVQ